jgi:hypothetical protein
MSYFIYLWWNRRRSDLTLISSSLASQILITNGLAVPKASGYQLHDEGPYSDGVAPPPRSVCIDHGTEAGNAALCSESTSSGPPSSVWKQQLTDPSYGAL